MLREWEKKYPGRIDSIFGALGNVVPSHLMDRALFDFGAVKAGGIPTADGDIAFDVDPALCDPYCAYRGVCRYQPPPLEDDELGDV